MTKKEYLKQMIDAYGDGIIPACIMTRVELLALLDEISDPRTADEIDQDEDYYDLRNTQELARS